MRTLGPFVVSTLVACSAPQTPSPRPDPFDTAAVNTTAAPKERPVAATSSSALALRNSPQSTSAEPNPEPAPDPDPPDLPDPDTTLAIGNGTDVVIELLFDSKREIPELAVELKRANKKVSRRAGWKEVTHFDLKKLHPCDSWSTRLSRELIGKINAVRLSLICRIGEDYLTSTEIAVLLDPDDLRTIWAGPADEWVSSMDSCIQSRHVTFRAINPKTLEKTILDSTIWSDQHIEEGAKARLKEECKVGSKRSIERVVLP